MGTEKEWCKQKPRKQCGKEGKNKRILREAHQEKHEDKGPVQDWSNH